MQYEFHFVFPYPPGCLHVSEHGSSGFIVDDRARVCSLVCAERWAKERKRVLYAESRSYRNSVSRVAYSTCSPSQLNKKVHAPINEKPP